MTPIAPSNRASTPPSCALIRVTATRVNTLATNAFFIISIPSIFCRNGGDDPFRLTGGRRHCGVLIFWVLRAPGGDSATCLRGFVVPSGTADQNTRRKHQRTTDDDLDGCRNRRRIHVTVSNPGDDRQLSEHDHERADEGHAEVRDEKRQRMANPTNRGHGAADDAAHQRMATSRERSEEHTSELQSLRH